MSAAQLYAQLGAQLRDQLYGQLDDQIYGQLGAQLRDQLDAQLRDQLYGQLDDQLRAQLNDQLNDQLHDQSHERAPAVTTCPCAYVAPTGVEPWSAAWHVGHRAWHLAAYPACGDATRASLDLFVRLAESDRMRPPRQRGVGGCL